MINKIRQFLRELRAIHHNNPTKLCTLYIRKGCSHVDGFLCDFPNCQMYHAYTQIDEMHNHPITEEREGIPANRVLVDAKFRCLFERIYTWYDSTHIVVSRQEYEELKR